MPITLNKFNGLVLAMLVTQALPAYAEALQKYDLRLSKSLAQKPSPNNSANASYKTYAKAAQNLGQCQGQDLVASDKALSLNDVLQQALCKNPALSQALQSIAEKQADIDLADSAFSPRVSANAEVATDRIPSSNSGAGSLSKSATGSINLSWLLFDFGSRDASLEQARHTLTAALNAQENTSIVTLIDTLKVYTDALTAYGKLNALNASEATARQSLTIAKGRYEAKVGGLSDKLQAETALAQASLDRSKANGAWLSARGALAIAMGVDVHTPLSLVDADEAFPAIDTSNLLENLVDEVKSQHPRIRSNRAEIQALQARLASIKGEYKGSLSLSSNAAATASFDKNTQLRNNVNISLQANIPLYSGKEQTAREAQINAQIGNKQAQIEQIQNELSNDIWKNAQEIITETDNLAATEQLLNAANQNYLISLGRYKAGVGTILDLLLAQATLAKAQQQLEETKIAIVQARIRLAMATGRLNVLKFRQ
jgi:outer membrane protein